MKRPIFANIRQYWRILGEYSANIGTKISDECDNSVIVSMEGNHDVKVVLECIYLICEVLLWREGRVPNSRQIWRQTVKIG